MTTARTIDNYGGIKSDVKPISVPTAQMSSTDDNRRSEDLAQLTRAPFRGWVKWILSSASAPVAVASNNISGASQMGLGSAQLPTVQKTATGHYTITYPATWTDALGVVEPIILTHAAPSIEGSTIGVMQILTYASNVITVEVWDSSNAPSDLGGTGVACLHLG